MRRENEKAEIGIIGGSGFYDLAKDLKEIKVETPYGPPSDKIALGIIAGRKVAFLPRHNKTHDVPPHKINYRANVWALYSLGISQIITATNCGSLQTQIKPGDFVILDQFVDRTKGRIDTFYDGPIVTHVSAAFPYCSRIRRHAIKTAENLSLKIHQKGTVVVIQGPRFSTAAESAWFTKMGWSVVNMTQYPEVILVRELQMCYGAIALVTDWDVGLVAGGKIKPVSVEMVIKTFKNNISKVKKLILKMIESWPKTRICDCKNALKGARLS